MDDAFSNLNVLIVDGTGRCRKFLRDVLPILDITRIAAVEDARQALTSMQNETYDIVFCDQDCVGLNPVAFTRAARRDVHSRNRRIPVIFVAPAIQKRQVELLRDSGANDVLIAPLSVDSVRRKIRAALKSTKAFIEDQGFVGPDRRYREEQDFLGKERRGSSRGRPRPTDRFAD